MSLDASLNRQDYSNSGSAFCYTDLQLEVLQPVAGPVDGNTRLLARGAGLVSHGCHTAATAEPKQCRFIANGTDPMLQPASVSGALQALVCYSPAIPATWQVGIPHTRLSWRAYLTPASAGGHTSHPPQLQSGGQLQCLVRTCFLWTILFADYTCCGLYLLRIDTVRTADYAHCGL